MFSKIVHFHLFKNAGSSFDTMLRENFGRNFREYDTGRPGDRLKPEQWLTALREDPAITALSSHQAVLSIDVCEKESVLPVFFLRHPIDRLFSVYTFEHRTARAYPSSQKAAESTFSEWVKWHLDREKSPIRNYHTNQLGGSAKALDAVEQTPFFGIVEFFPESVELFKAVCAGSFSVTASYETTNVNSARLPTLSKRLRGILAELGRPLWSRLLAANAEDLALYAFAIGIFWRKVSSPELNARARGAATL